MQVLWYVAGIVAIAVVLAASIALHELGHLFWAKRFGVRVDQYMIGFGPTLFSWRRGETEYGFKALPLGGYISMIGMYPPEATAEAEPAEASSGRRSLGRWMRDLVHSARRASAETIPPGEEGRTFYRLPVWRRLVIMVGGPFMNLLIALVCYAVLVSAFGTVQSTTTLGSVSQCVLPADATRATCEAGDTPAPGAAAGLQPGDQLLEIDGQDVEAWSDVQDIVQPLAGQTVSVTVLRDGQAIVTELTPVASTRYVYDRFGRVERDADGEKRTVTVGFIGIAPTTERVRQPVTAALPMLGDNLQLVGEAILTLPQKLVQAGQAAFGDEARDPDGPVSIVGVGRIAGEVTASDQIDAQEKVISVVSLAAQLNVALFAFNLIPLMPLDGGHAAGALWEGVRRGWARLRGRPAPRPFDAARLMPLTLVVFALLTAMGVLLIYADLVKPITLGG
jgi:membrane-associated protease RseP (regulator of RpoE activity)